MFKNFFSKKSLEECKEEQDKLMESVIENTDETIDTNKAARLLVNQDFDGAIEAYTDLCNKYPSSIGLFESQIGAAYFFKADYKTAEKYYLSSMDHGFTETADYNLWEVYEIFYQQSGDKSYMERYLKLFPNGECKAEAEKILNCH